MDHRLEAGATLFQQAVRVGPVCVVDTDVMFGDKFLRVGSGAACCACGRHYEPLRLVNRAGVRVAIPSTQIGENE